MMAGNAVTTPSTGAEAILATPVTGQSHRVAIDMKSLLERYLEKSSLETTFSWSIKRVMVPEPPQPPSLLEALHNRFATGSEYWQADIGQYMNYAMTQSNPHRVITLLDNLKVLVSRGVIPPKLVCEAVLMRLDINNLLTWERGLALVKDVVGGVDYKGCRDLMKTLLDRFDHLPKNIAEHLSPGLHQGRELLKYMLDRNAALLPAYFAHDEIQRRYIPPNASPHWALEDVILTVKRSMEAAAELISGNMLPHLIPLVGITNMSSIAWKLDPNRHCFSLYGRLPYQNSLLQPQEGLVYRVLAQPQSKDAFVSILSLSKQMQPHPLLESCLVTLAVECVRVTENIDEEEEESIVPLWSHLASQLVILTQIQVINPTRVITTIKQKLSGSRVSRGRGYLMWAMLHFLSTTIPSSSRDSMALREEFNTVLSLLTTLYHESEPLPVPDTSHSSCVFELSGACSWLLLTKRAQMGSVLFPSDPPPVLSQHLEFLQQQQDDLSPQMSCYALASLLNAYCLHPDISNTILNALLDSFPRPVTTAPTNVDVEGEGNRTATGNHMTGKTGRTTPIPMDCINSLVSQAKLRMSEKIKVQVMKVVDIAKQPQAMDSTLVSPALLETLSRVLLWVGTKIFQSQLIPLVFRLQVWNILQLLLEVASFRVHSQLAHPLRLQFIQVLHTLANVSIIPTQLFICAENTALRIISALASTELPLQLIKNAQDPKALFHLDSDELNKTMLLVFAQSLYVSKVDLGSWLENLLKELEAAHPTCSSLFHWPEGSLQFLPVALKQQTVCSTSLPSANESRHSLRARVEEEFQKLQSKPEADLHKHYSEGDAVFFILCVIWKQLSESGQVTPLLARLLQRLRLSPKKLASLPLRKLVDYIVFTCPQPATPSNPHFMKVVGHLGSLVWKYFLCPFDRLLLCMLWRSYSIQDMSVCLSLVHQLFLQEPMMSRVKAFTSMVPAEFFHEPKWGEKHAEYLKMFPECFQLDTSGTGTNTPSMPMFFGNICLRILPVVDLSIQRLVESPRQYQTMLQNLLEMYGPLYRYHEYPIRFLYTILHYYHATLGDVPELRRQLVRAILTPQSSAKLSLYFSSEFLDYMRSGSVDWKPPQHFFSELVGRLVEGLKPLNPSLSSCSWPMSEFSGPACGMLYCSAVEVMACPLTSSIVTKEIIHVIVTRATVVTASKDWVLAMVNGTGALLSALPDSYACTVLFSEITSLLQTAPFASAVDGVPPSFSYNTFPGCLLNLTHAFLHHSNSSVLAKLPSWLQGQLKQLIVNEVQLLFICHLLGPLISRLHEKPKVLLEIVEEIYHLIRIVDQKQGGHVKNSELICDLLYHIKYMHIGDQKKEEIEKVVTSLHPLLRMRLRFLVHSLSTPSVESKQQLGPGSISTTMPAPPEPMQT